jgi:hypothetical protein
MKKTCVALFTLSLVASLALGAPFGSRDPLPIRDWTVPALASPESERSRSVMRNGTMELVGSDFHGMVESNAAVPSKDSRFVTMVPCRVVDTRNPTGAYGGPKFSQGTIRTFDIDGGPCAGIPANAAAYSLSLGVTQTIGNGAYITAWPAGATQPVVATITWNQGLTLTTAAIVPAGVGGAISVFAANETHLTIDINGYFREGPGSLSLNYINEVSAVPSMTPAFFRTIGSFTKVSASTTIHAALRSHMSSSGVGFCQFQLRISGQVPAGFTGEAAGAVLMGAPSYESYVDAGRWTGLGAGTHAVSIWLRGNASSCTDNVGNFLRQVLIEEH